MQLTTSDLARILGKSERTITRWLHDGKSGLTRLENGMIEVSEQDLIRLRPQDTDTLILEKLASIDERLRRIEEMLVKSADSADLPEKKQVAPKRHSLVSSAERDDWTGSPASKSLLPDGLVTATAFARLHFPAPGGLSDLETKRHEDKIAMRVKRQVEYGHIPAKFGQWPSGKSYARWALDATGRARFYELNHEREGFQACDECPHQGQVLL